MISSARPRSCAPPRPSATSASPSSCSAPVNSTVAMVENAAATKGEGPRRQAVQQQPGHAGGEPADQQADAGEMRGTRAQHRGSEAHPVGQPSRHRHAGEELQGQQVVPQPAHDYADGCWSETPADSKLAISARMAQADCSNGQASTAPEPSPRRSPRSSSARGRRAIGPEVAQHQGMAAFVGAVRKHAALRDVRLQRLGHQHGGAGDEAVHHDHAALGSGLQHGAHQGGDLEAAEGRQRLQDPWPARAAAAPRPAPRACAPCRPHPCRCPRPRNLPAHGRPGGPAAARRRRCCRCPSLPAARVAGQARHDLAHILARMRRSVIAGLCELSAVPRHLARQQARARRESWRTPQSTTVNARPCWRASTLTAAPPARKFSTICQVTSLIGRDAAGGQAVVAQHTSTCGSRRRGVSLPGTSPICSASASRRPSEPRGLVLRSSLCAGAAPARGRGGLAGLRSSWS